MLGVSFKSRTWTVAWHDTPSLRRIFQDPWNTPPNWWKKSIIKWVNLCCSFVSGVSIGLSCRQGSLYDTNQNNAVLQGKPLKLTTHLHQIWSLSKWGACNDLCLDAFFCRFQLKIVHMVVAFWWWIWLSEKKIWLNFLIVNYLNCSIQSIVKLLGFWAVNRFSPSGPKLKATSNRCQETFRWLKQDTRFNDL